MLKNGKDLSNGAPNIKLWNHNKKTHFPVFAKNFRRPCMKMKTFFANFQILGPLGCQGWVVTYTSKCEKVKITAPFCATMSVKLIMRYCGSSSNRWKYFWPLESAGLAAANLASACWWLACLRKKIWQHGHGDICLGVLLLIFAGHDVRDESSYDSI